MGTLMIVVSTASAISLILSRVSPDFLLKNSTTITATTISFLIFFSIFIWKVIIYPNFFSPLLKLPQPPNGSFINGQFSYILRASTGVPHADWMQNVPNDGLIHYTAALNRPRVLLTSVDGLREVLSTKSYDFPKPKELVENVKRIIGNGVLFAEGDEHRRQRKNLMPAFSYRHIKDLYPVFWSKTRTLIHAVDAVIASTNQNDNTPTDPSSPDDKSASSSDNTATIDIANWISRSTLDIIGEAGMGVSFDAIGNPQSELLKAYQMLSNPSKAARVLGIMTSVFPGWFVQMLPVGRNMAVAKASDIIKKTCRDVIRSKKEKMASGEKQTGAGGVDIVSAALDSGGFTDEELVDQLMTFLAAGHETTASAFQWAIYLLCKNPSTQSRLRASLYNLPPVRDEKTQASIRDGNNAHPPTITPELLDSMAYLQAVLSETLRFIPPVPITMREAAHSTTILGKPIPKGTNVIMSPVAINKSPAFWGEDAGEFNPERWLMSSNNSEEKLDRYDPSGKATSNYAFLTFLHGPRSCIGQQFARAEFAALLAGWIKAFETELVEKDKEVEVQSGITQKPKGGLRVKVRRVE